MQVHIFLSQGDTHMVQEHHTSITECLKEAISDNHTRMESLPFFIALTKGELPFESYVGNLRTMAVILGTLEHELSHVTLEEVRRLCLSRPSRLIHLRRDLSMIDPLFIADILPANQQAQKIAEWIRRYRIEQPSNLLGILYVLEGSTLGNAMHLPDVIKTFGPQISGTACFYAGYGDKTAENWKMLLSAMNSLQLNQEGRERIIQVAKEFFDQLEVLFASLYPIDTARLEFTASILNPEAGNHAVPDTVDELQAAVTAARKCREEFPYFNERYQERGRSFAKSDAAWLVTLVSLPQTQLMNQVEWLGRVLANRGMPRITLERQLELLYGELAAALPEEREQYTGLLEAAGNLAGERFRHIPEPVFSRLAEEFRDASDGELQGRLQGTGLLIVSAVCDKAAGINDAESSLLSWLLDKDLFPERWISAVRKTLDKAHEERNNSL